MAMGRRPFSAAILGANSTLPVKCRKSFSWVQTKTSSRPSSRISRMSVSRCLGLWWPM